MRDRPDERIEIIFACPCSRQPQDALLIERSGRSSDDGSPAKPGIVYFSGRTLGWSSHSPGCSCCISRNPVAKALGDLYIARAKGTTAWFSRVLAHIETAEGRVAVTEAVGSDSITAARFRLSVPPE